MRLFAAVLLSLSLSGHALAQAASISPSDTIQSTVSAQKGKRVTLRLHSGQELSGLVREVTDKLIVLGEVSGREYFDAVVATAAVEAVLIRTRQ